VVNTGSLSGDCARNGLYKYSQNYWKDWTNSWMIWCALRKPLRSALRALPNHVDMRRRNSSFAGCLGTRVPLSCRRTYGCRGSLVYPSDMCACFPLPEATTSLLSPRTMDEANERKGTR